MKIMEELMHRILPKISPLYPRRPELLDNIQDSYREWKLCNDHFRLIDSDLVDYMIYRLNAAERHYMAMIALAKSNGVTAWPADNLKSEVRNKQ